MKYVKLLSTTAEFQSLFPTAKILELTRIDNKNNILKIKLDDDIIYIEHHQEPSFYMDLENQSKIIDMDSLYTNPIENLTIICDRKLWYDFYVNLMRNNPEDFLELENRYVEKNVTVFFNFAILEAVNYEVEQSEFLYDFKFNHIKITDYELFKDKKNFYYDSFYSLYHLIAEGQLCTILNPNLKYGWDQYLIDFSQMFENLHVVNKIHKNTLYNHTCQKPRFHRVKFLLEADRCGILNRGRNNVNIKFLDEYKQATEDGIIYTDNGKKFSENHLKYFNKKLFDEFKKIENKLNITPDDPSFLYDHLRNYFENKEYNEAYIEVVGETHCIFELEYGFFTEKSIKPILSNNFLMVYGSNKVYSELKRIGIELFINEFGLNGIEDKNELEQIDMIVNAIKNIDKNYVMNLYIKKYPIIVENRKKLIEYYCNIINKINKALIKTKTI